MTFSVRRFGSDRKTRERFAHHPSSGQTFTVAVHTSAGPDGRVSTVAPAGEVDVDTAYRIREAVDAVLIAHSPAKIVIDLGRVSLIDSVGIGVLVSCYHAAAAFSVPLVAVSPSCTVYRQLWVSGLVGLFRLATPHGAPGARDLNVRELTVPEVTPDPAAA